MGKRSATFASGARRSEVVKARFDLIPPQGLRRLAERYGLGAIHYGEYNWQKGMPFSDTLNHVQEHIERVKERVALIVESERGDEEAIKKALKRSFAEQDDDLAAAAWGLFALMVLINEGALVPDQSWQVKK